MINELSILLPAFNVNCSKLVQQLVHQAEEVCSSEGFRFEVIVAEDGSTDEVCIGENREISHLPCCRHIIRRENIGRAAIRNFLAGEAKYKWLLFMDSDMSVGNDFLHNYLRYDKHQVVDGGYTLLREDKRWRGNLRYCYELKELSAHSCQQRRKRPYQGFHTSNFLVCRDTLLAHPFDEELKEYGYEDVLWGRVLEENGITISHIDNPVIFTMFEDNDSYLLKTEAALRTLFVNQRQLSGYSRLLKTSKWLHNYGLDRVIKVLFRICGKGVRKCLASSSLPASKACPQLFLFKFYKLGFFLNIASLPADRQTF